MALYVVGKGAIHERRPVQAACRHRTVESSS
jgi:hypothetical protein